MFSLTVNKAFGNDFLCKNFSLTCPEVLFKNLYFKQDDNERYPKKQYFLPYSSSPYTGYVKGSRKGKIVDGFISGCWSEFDSQGKLVNLQYWSSYGPAGWSRQAVQKECR